MQVHRGRILSAAFNYFAPMCMLELILCHFGGHLGRKKWTLDTITPILPSLSSDALWHHACSCFGELTLSPVNPKPV